MDPTQIELPRLEVAGLLRQYGLSPKKGLGQNFLADPGALRTVVAAAEIPPDAAVLEVGPGLGHLTRYLSRAARRVTAVELDRALIPVLEQVLADFPNVTLVQGDILETDPAALMDEADYLVVANIPYYITSAVIRHLLEARCQPSRMVLTVQHEVAQRICAAPGDLSLLALSVQVYGSPRVAARLAAGAFIPPPNVDSAVVRIDLYPQPLIPTAQLATFFNLTKAGFSQKRKTLRNALSGGLGIPTAQAGDLLAAAEIDPQRRAETLTIPEWSRLVQARIEAGGAR
jgi:16S rRNA (adenine1518-N6/adenine1519-N6)-dimethyltransferase